MTLYLLEMFNSLHSLRERLNAAEEALKAMEREQGYWKETYVVDTETIGQLQAELAEAKEENKLLLKQAEEGKRAIFDRDDLQAKVRELKEWLAKYNYPLNQDSCRDKVLQLFPDPKPEPKMWGYFIKPGWLPYPTED